MPQVPQCGSCVICAARQLSRSCRTRRRAAPQQQALRRKTGKERPRRRRSGYPPRECKGPTSVMPVTLSDGKINGVRNGTGARQVPSVRRVAMRALSNLGPASSTLRAGSLMTRALAVHKTWVTAPKHVERNERNNKKPARCRSCSAQECGSARTSVVTVGQSLRGPAIDVTRTSPGRATRPAFLNCLLALRISLLAPPNSLITPENSLFHYAGNSAASL